MRVTITGRFPILRAGMHPLRSAVDEWRAGGETTPEAALADASLSTAQADAARELIGAQEALGVDVPSDGYVPIYDEWFAAAPMAGVPVGAVIRYLDTNTYYHRWILKKQPVRTAAGPAVAAYRCARAMTTKPVKPCLFGPYTLWAYAVREGKGAAPESFEALVEIWAAEVAALAAEGAQWIQLDESVLLRPQRRGDFPLVAHAVETIAAAAPQVTLVLHLACGAVGEMLAPLLKLRGLGGLGLDFTAQYRKANLSALNGWKGDALLQAGVANGRQIGIESPAEIRETLAAITAHVPAERCLAAPNTGLHYLPRHAAFAKLGALVAAAHERKR